MNSFITKITKYGENFSKALTIEACEDSFKVLADKWDKDFPDKKIPEGFRNMMEIQFEFMRGILEEDNNGKS